MKLSKIRTALLMALLAFALSLIFLPARAEAQQGNKYIIYAEQGIWAAGQCRTNPHHFCRLDGVHVDRIEDSTNRIALECRGEIKGKMFVVKFISKLPARARTLPVREDVVLNEETSRSLGFRQVTILKGNYAISRRGSVQMRVRTEE